MSAQPDCAGGAGLSTPLYLKELYVAGTARRTGVAELQALELRDRLAGLLAFAHVVERFLGDA